MITGILIGDQSVIANIQRKRQEAKERVRKTVEALSIDLQAHIKANKLTGQVLKVQSGRLRRSINHRIQDEGSRVWGVVGTNVEYARLHEYGFSGAMDVREHLRRARSGMVQVRAHKRFVNMPERSFLRSSLREFDQRARTELLNALLGAVE